MIDKDVFPQDVDFNYKIRCSQHNFKPYVYCEMCMVRTDLQAIKEDVRRETNSTLAHASLAINVINAILEKHRKQIEHLQIELRLLKELKNG